ncbi:MAG TPA: Bor family protein [Longimicrobiaceae bacterium]|nr:Bor family protein [Longimicrobiaceae bacterium]
MRKSVLSLFAITLLASGCYHATIDTGRSPSGQSIHKSWAHSFLYGLVPPSTIETAAQCPNGVAKVETQLSFLNQLASFLTGGIYTPMTITVQCAAAGTALAAPEGAEVITVAAGAEQAVLQDALNQAMERAIVEDAPVFVTFSEVQ